MPFSAKILPSAVAELDKTGIGAGAGAAIDTDGADFSHRNYVASQRKAVKTGRCGDSSIRVDKSIRKFGADAKRLPPPEGCTWHGNILYDAKNAFFINKIRDQHDAWRTAPGCRLMADPGAAPSGDAQPSSPTPAERGTLAGTLRHLWPYIWPSDRADLKMRVVWSIAAAARGRSSPR